MAGWRQLVEVETASRQAEVVACLQVGQAAMAALQKEISIEDVEKLLEDSEDSRAHLQVRRLCAPNSAGVTVAVQALRLRSHGNPGVTVAV